MTRLRSYLTGAVLAGALAVSAAAGARADGYNWGGLYVGGHLGAAWTNVDWNFVTATPPVTDRGVPGCTTAGNCFTHDLNGLIYGGHIGLQHHLAPNWVLGLEASLSGGDDINGSSPGPQDDFYRSRLESLMLIEGKLGYAANRWLLYVKGGFAAGWIETRVTDVVPINVGDGTRKEWHTGWTVGAGLDYALTNHWILGVDYNFVQLASKRHTIVLNGSGGTIVDDVDPDGLHMVTARLSYKWGRVEAPLK